MELIVLRAVQEKLAARHQVTIEEVKECFANRSGRFLMDIRERHRTLPPTLWFIAMTNLGRHLKVIFIEKKGAIHLKSAFEPNEVETRIYSHHGQEP